MGSALLHHSCGSSELAPDLFTGPAGGLDGPRLEFAVGPSFLDQSDEPGLPESLDQLAVRVGIGQITRLQISTFTAGD